jgi:hypothetical protein
MSSHIARASALALLLFGFLLLFAADEILPRVIPGFPVAGAWIGQLVAAGWLALAAMNWLTRSTLLGGIYGRPVVIANTALYFVSATVLLRAAMRPGAVSTLWFPALVASLFAAAYGRLLFWGPFERT